MPDLTTRVGQLMLARIRGASPLEYLIPACTGPGVLSADETMERHKIVRQYGDQVEWLIEDEVDLAELLGTFVDLDFEKWRQWRAGVLESPCRE